VLDLALPDFKHVFDKQHTTGILEVSTVLPLPAGPRIVVTRVTWIAVRRTPCIPCMRHPSPWEIASVLYTHVLRKAFAHTVSEAFLELRSVAFQIAIAGTLPYLVEDITF
jgi:hypothetical protein